MRKSISTEISNDCLLDVNEAAELLRVSHRTVYAWVSQRRIPFRKAGRRLLFSREELVAWTQPNLDGDQYLELIK